MISQKIIRQPLSCYIFKVLGDDDDDVATTVGEVRLEIRNLMCVSEWKNRITTLVNGETMSSQFTSQSLSTHTQLIVVLPPFKLDGTILRHRRKVYHLQTVHSFIIT